MRYAPVSLILQASVDDSITTSSAAPCNNIPPLKPQEICSPNMRFTNTVLAAAALAVTGAAAAPADTATLETRQAANTITVDFSKAYQRMDGFGFSLAFQRANLITNMSDKTKQRELLDLLFNRTTGAGFSIIRNGIGSTPNSNSDYMNTIAPINPGGPNAEPKYQWDGKDSGQLWVSQQAVNSYGVRTIYASKESSVAFRKKTNTKRGNSVH